MQHRERRGEARAKAADELRGEPDFRHQDERAAARGEYLRDELQIHLGLAAAGDAVQDEGAEAAPGAAHRRDGACLLGVELEAATERLRVDGACALRQRRVDELDPAALARVRAAARRRPG